MQENKKQNIDVQIPFGKKSPSTAEMEDIMGQKNTELNTSDLVQNVEKSLADKTIPTVVPINTLSVSTKVYSRSEFLRPGNLEIELEI